MTDWLHDETGRVRRELFTQSEAEVREKAAEYDAWVASGALSLFRHQVFVDPAKHSISEGTDGWMDVVRVTLNSQRPFVLVIGATGGGFIEITAIDQWRSVPWR